MENVILRDCKELHDFCVFLTWFEISFLEINAPKNLATILGIIVYKYNSNVASSTVRSSQIHLKCHNDQNMVILLSLYLESKSTYYLPRRVKSKLLPQVPLF